MSRTPPDPRRPGLLSTPGQKIVAVLVFAVVLYAGLYWWQSRRNAGPERPAAAAGTVVREAPADSGRSNLTVRYTVDGKQLETTKDVATAAFTAQGKVVWVCFAPSDPTNAALRLPEDQLCGQR
ncbi:hypothetical protein HJ588_00235 [Flexivirga sp. ID2601S]|uniref:DUF3592 domain-containing protein n=1 Tax=Flexivirga aerilata TaxID=1656889 RepID=A0A849A9V4_9MICO|nr:hypothetical protein [Flexivirga aerilata]NNG37704.1 hypothetical protein [Flexivirga aerilata]